MSNNKTETDFWAPLFVKNLGAISPMAAITGSFVMICFSGLAYKIIQYDNQINRRTKLLTRFNCTSLWCLICYTLTILFDSVRFTTGIPMPPGLCTSRVYFTQAVRQLMAFTTLADTISHYRFLTFKSDFPIIKDDLVHRIFLRSALGCIIVNMMRQACV